MRLTFLGAASEVTGSATLVEADGLAFLVDCGLFQGGREAWEKNRAPFAFAPRALDFVLLTHAHLDHCGLLPRLVAAGYGRDIHCTPATADLVPIMLEDSAHIMEKEAEWARAREEGRGGAAERALYTVADAERVADFVAAQRYGREFRPHPRVRVRFQDAGHILGSAIAEVWVEEHGRETKLVFSGDLGQPARPVVRDPVRIDTADVLVVESTYGNRDHKGMRETLDELVAVVEQTRRRGNVVVPAFALGRTQDLLVVLAELARAGRIGGVEVFVDSPLAAQATAVTVKHQATLDTDFQRVVAEAQRGELPVRVRFTQSVDDSKAINRVRSGAIIVAASGMCDGGRIKHHLRNNLPRAECAVLFTGFQAQGTLGRRIVDGAKVVRIFGEEVPVRARVHTLGGLSAHADRSALLAWLGAFARAPRHVFVNHGEAEIANVFAATVRDRFGWNVRVPGALETVGV
ncbi:MAG: MBL fold metallo-hydrolase [Burkholderiales bacterium]|nr:MBL fold metallo-hydrolase [Burkholderiales bacterium]